MKPVVIRCRDLKSGQEQVHAFGFSPIIIGRAKDADVRLDVDHVSNFHAQIDADEGSVAFTDLDSSNGSVVNGVARRHQRVPVTSDTRIQIGAFLIEIGRELPAGVVARRRVAKKDDTTGGGARQDRTNVLDFDAKEALRSLPGLRRREVSPGPAPGVKLEPIDPPAVEEPRPALALAVRPTPGPVLASAVSALASPATASHAFPQPSRTATLVQPQGPVTPQPRAAQASSRPHSSQKEPQRRVSADIADSPRRAAARYKLTVAVVVAIGLVLGAILGLLVSLAISSEGRRTAGLEETSTEPPGEVTR